MRILEKLRHSIIPLCQAGDVFSLIIGQGGSFPLAFVVPILNTSYEIKSKLSQASCITWSHGCLEGPLGITLHSWTMCSAWYDPLHSWFLREKNYLFSSNLTASALECQQVEPHRAKHVSVSPVIILTPRSSQLCLKFPRSFSVLGASEEEGAEKIKKHWQAMSQVKSMRLRMLINLSFSDTLGSRSHLLLQMLHLAGPFDWIRGADRWHWLHCKGDGRVIRRGGVLYWGRDYEFSPENPLQLLNQMLRNLGVGRRKGWVLGKREKDIICFPKLLPPSFTAIPSVPLHRFLF